ncbi:thiol:disulfide interchange protein TlpA [Roseibium sediminis]|uniref:thiol:disulfide interchange protein TlpA n=1 Tax=Roseibium sediminis TaxID=1775174 RepID=UPI00123CC242|nr:TlpA disulfide reductase family protein [Roseibium sediminis]
MTKPTETGTGSKRNLIVAGLAGAIVAAAAVYVIAAPGGNISNAQSCTVELAAAKAAKPHAKGEVAAFIPAQAPLKLDDLLFKGNEDQDIAMSSFAGRTVLVNLWATWCAPCRKEMPALNDLQVDMGGEDFEVVAINLDRGGPAKPKAFLQEVGATDLTYYHDSSNDILKTLRAKARATGLPTTILVGPSGCEIGTMYGPAEWASDDAKALIRSAMDAASGT